MSFLMAMRDTRQAAGLRKNDLNYAVAIHGYVKELVTENVYF